MRQAEDTVVQVKEAVQRAQRYLPDVFEDYALHGPNHLEPATQSLPALVRQLLFNLRLDSLLWPKQHL